ncbi:hypothetical protein FHW67_000723 [Herbaspirillum sp. Sphag1AN]|uniref:hypothetical protein n=1 Tax=unclassified Herbaspirillum TaxID=2624150 RepID=UPI0017EA845B|nr:MULTISPECIES: hypothetical protein [unclassified Herbaspirillum]MBB3211475.1 hypothetical protein [Herbaspirillum sp. Sphag1AN]MBB3245259.1 hypothetical protein [Herbaspirillum sp. Sphag64]
MSDSVPPPSAATPVATRTTLISSAIGFLLALACAVWAGVHFAQSTSSIGYGALTGLSFGALFAFGQRIKQYFLPASSQRKQKRPINPAAVAELRPAQRAAANAKPLNVTFDEDQIQILRGTTKLHSIDWQDLDGIVIDIGGSKLPIPNWVLTAQDRESTIRIPNDTLGIEQLTEQFRLRLSGYDNDATDTAIISAMGAAQGSFTLWQRGVALDDTD